MIDVGTNDTARMIADAIHGYRMVLSVIRLPHLPLSRDVIAALNGKEIVGEFGRPRELTDMSVSRFMKDQRLTQIKSSRSAMKISRVGTEYRDGVQVVTGWVRSIGPRPNLESFLREFKPPALHFAMRALEREASTHPGAMEVYQIVTWDLVPAHIAP